MSIHDPTDGFDLQRLHAELLRWVARIAHRARMGAAQSARDADFIEACVHAFRSRKPTKATRWCLENGAHFAASVTDGIGSEYWAAMLYALLRRDYGGETVWQRKRPAAPKRAAARYMNAKELEQTFGISPARAYQLLNEVHGKRKKF